MNETTTYLAKLTNTFQTNFSISTLDVVDKDDDDVWLFAIQFFRGGRFNACRDQEKDGSILQPQDSLLTLHSDVPQSLK